MYMLLLLMTTLCKFAMADMRPNILFLMADEMDGRIFDASSPQVKPPMPNLNRLAKAGAVFTHAYNQAPQCVPSRSAMLVGLRTDQIGVYDNFLGGIAVNGDSSNPDPHCVQSFNRSYCIRLSQNRKNSPATFIDRLYNEGYGVHLYGKMHAGWGLDRYPGTIGEFPFTNGRSQKALREWTRGLGPETNIKGKTQLNHAPAPSDTEPKPATGVDYQCMNSCVSILRKGLFNNKSAPQFLYCSLIVPHPPYASNHTFMKAVENMTIDVPSFVPKSIIHPNDRTTAILKSTWNADQFNASNIEYFRRVYFSMCFESDDMLGQIIDALDDSGAADRTYVVMISDHGEDNFEHRQVGKNNMYDSASRVAMLLRGPGIAPGQVISNLTSLNDVYPTIVNMAGIAANPDNLAGSSLLQLAAPEVWAASRIGINSNARKDYVIAQYHSVFSVTGEFMIRQGKHKLITYGSNAPFGDDFPMQLFDLENDPWELHNIGHNSSDVVDHLLRLLRTEINETQVDLEAKRWQRQMFLDTTWKGSRHCMSTFEAIYGVGALNETDAKRISQWIGQPCPFVKPVPDPNCETGIKDIDGTACCSSSCSICSHPYKNCSKRPGGAHDCCPSIIVKDNNACKSNAPPCFLKVTDGKPYHP